MNINLDPLYMVGGGPTMHPPQYSLGSLLCYVAGEISPATKKIVVQVNAEGGCMVDPLGPQNLLKPTLFLCISSLDNK